MERDDATQEGTQLPPTLTTELIARAVAERVIIQHLTLCPFAQLRIEERLRKVEGRFLLLIGFMVGSGLLGGAAGAAIIKAIAP